MPLDKVGLITLDAHFDMRDLDEGLSNGNPVRALIEDGLPGANIAQVGLASFANSRDDARRRACRRQSRRHHRRGAARRNFAGRSIARSAHVRHCDAIVVDCDIDVIDRSQFPAAPGARPGGMAVHDFFAAVRRLAADPRVRRDRSHRMGSAARPDRPQRFDRRAAGSPSALPGSRCARLQRCGGSGTTVNLLVLRS